MLVITKEMLWIQQKISHSQYISKAIFKKQHLLKITKAIDTIQYRKSTNKNKCHELLWITLDLEPMPFGYI